MNPTPMQHLTTEEIELWAQGILGAARAMHLSDCSLCRTEAEQERKVIRELAQLPHFAPATNFADKVMARVRIPTRSGEFSS